MICEDGDTLRITDLAALSVAEAETGLTGYVRRDQIYEWPTAEGLSFSDLAFIGKLPEIEVWDSRDALLKFMETGGPKADAPRFPREYRRHLASENVRTTLSGAGLGRRQIVRTCRAALFRRAGLRRDPFSGCGGAKGWRGGCGDTGANIGGHRLRV
jgi:hypothetical protein